MTYQPHQSEDLAIKAATGPVEPDGQHYEDLNLPDDDWELPPKACDKDRPEGCESCQ